MTEQTIVWTDYIADIFLVLLFLFVLLFFKPSEQEKSDLDDEQEKPNPLEQMLVTEQSDEDADNDLKREIDES